MGRKSVMIDFDSSAFRELVKSKGMALSDLEPVTGVSKQALNGWLSTSKIPPRQLHTISDQLSWSTIELGRVLKRNSSNPIRFRSHRHTMVAEGSEQTARRIATDFFALESLGGDYNKDSFVFRVGKDVPAPAVADGILRQLNLKRGQFGIEELILSLARTNISVVFLDFGLHFSLGEKAEKNLKAFCAKNGTKYLIVIDSRMKVEDVAWVIFHELAHISCGDLELDADISIEENKKEEAFRNEVANEVLTPTDLLMSSKDKLAHYLHCPLRLLPSRVESIASDLGASFVGVVLALEKIGILTSQMKKYLWAVHHRRDSTRMSIKDFLPVATASTRDELIRSWDQGINTENLQPFLKLQLLVRQGLIEDKISTSRAAELIGIEAGEMDELANHWRAEVSDEAAY